MTHCFSGKCVATGPHCFSRSRDFLGWNGTPSRRFLFVLRAALAFFGTRGWRSGGRLSLFDSSGWTGCFATDLLGSLFREICEWFCRFRRFFVLDRSFHYDGRLVLLVTCLRRRRERIKRWSSRLREILLVQLFFLLGQYERQCPDQHDRGCLRRNLHSHW